MTRRSKQIWLAMALLVGVAASIPIAATWRWDAETTVLAGRLATSSPSMSSGFSAVATHQLPPPVSRYLRRVLPEGPARIVRVELVQEAEFFINGAWKPLRATQSVSTSPPGFVWDARIDMAPWLPAYVRDGYVDGVGSMRASIFGLYTLANQEGRGELDAGALQRYLGEAVWFPTALVPGAGITWEPVDDRRAIATIADGETSVSLEFRFNDRDEVVEVSGQRFAEHDGEYELRPWEVRCRDYRVQQDVLIPVFCDVAWVTRDGPVSYWRGRIVEIAYEFAR